MASKYVGKNDTLSCYELMTFIIQEIHVLFTAINFYSMFLLPNCRIKIYLALQT